MADKNQTTRELTARQFAQRASRIAVVAAAWSGDSLDLNLDGTVSADRVRQFTQEIRDRLAALEEAAGVN